VPDVRAVCFVADVEAVVQVFAQQPVPAHEQAEGSSAANPFALPVECSLLTPPLLQRQARARLLLRSCPCSATHSHTHTRMRPHAQVWLRQADADTESGDASASPSSPALQSAPPAPPLVYACSWWNAAAFAAAMPSSGAPIWRNLAAARTEAYRDLRTVYLGDNPALEAEFNAPGPFWGRHYVLYVGGQPLTVVYEVFGPRLREWLGERDGVASAKATLARQAAAREALST
jgi:hypothetical protein